AVGNGSCEILLAAAEALCEPGAEILYAWPAFSMYPYLPALTGAREVRVPLDGSETHDLHPMPAHLTAPTHPLLASNPNNPPTAPRPRSPPSSRAFLRTSPSSSTRPTSSSRPTTPPTPPSTCSPICPTSSSCAHSASATAWPGCGSATRSARRSSAPRSTPCA